MLVVVRAIQTYAGWLYALLAALIVVQLATMWRAGHEREVALFGLEREAATGKAVRAFVTLLLLVTIWSGIYTVATVVAPALPWELQEAGSAIPTTPQLSELPTAAPTDTETPTPAPAPRIVTSTPEPDP
jgi:hypothetical protein